jgi:glutamine cyclotransferase
VEIDYNTGEVLQTLDFSALTQMTDGLDDKEWVLNGIAYHE